ncbi:MAG: CBS domain-containing protein [Thermoguttaceae bacterium]
MIAAKDLMNPDVVTVDPDDTVWEVMATILEHDVSGLPVVNMPGQLLGFVSEFDLMDLVQYAQAAQHPIYYYMTREVHSVDENTTIDELAERFCALSVRRLPVLQGDRVVGIVSFRDLIGHLLRTRQQLPRELHVSHHSLPTPRAFDLRRVPHNQGHA